MPFDEVWIWSAPFVAKAQSTGLTQSEQTPQQTKNCYQVSKKIPPPIPCQQMSLLYECIKIIK